MPLIQHIEAVRVIHELILKPFGTYIIRASTENDHIISQIKLNQQTISIPYAVLSVRVDENIYHCPIMNYRLPITELNDENDLFVYYQQIPAKSLPELENEYIIANEETNWKISTDLFETEYIGMFSASNEGIKTDIRYNTPNGSHHIKVFKKLIKNNEQEFSILKTLSYFHIITFYGIYDEPEHDMKHLILADHGESLKSRYADIKFSNKFLLKQLTMIGYQIACGMIYLELKNIIHRDLHAGNILIDENNFIRIADFEHAICTENDQENCYESQKNLKTKFQIRRLAPECLPYPPESTIAFDSYDGLLNEFSSKSDVWAYGLIFIEILLGFNHSIYSYLLNESMEGDDNDDDDKEIRLLIEYIKIDQHVHRRPDDCPKKFYNLLKKCWIYSPDDRISFIDMRNEMLKLFKSEDE